MSSASISSPIVPYGADQTVYRVIDHPGAPGRACRETERSDLETVVRDLMTGWFDDPMQIVAFNTLEHWSQDLSADVASEIQARCDIDAAPLPSHLEDFVSRHARRARAASR
jgi:hypothetical protein